MTFLYPPGTVDFDWPLNHPEYGSKPWPVQAEAIRLSSGRRGWCHFLEQGLGKTGLTLAEFVHYYRHEYVDCLLVICPQSMKNDWRLAMSEWGKPEVVCGMWPTHRIPDGCGFVYLINFEAIRTGTAGLKAIKQLLVTRRVMMVVDESSAIGNPSSDTAKRVMELAPKAAMVRMLNGTPITSSVENYYAQIYSVGAITMNRYAFRRRFARMGGYMGKKVVGITNKDELGKILASCSFTAKKADWRSTLPPKVHSVVNLEMLPEQAKLYREMFDNFCLGVDGGNVVVEAAHVLNKIDMLRQITSGFIMHEGTVHEIVPVSENPKFSAVIDNVVACSNKSLVVYNYRYTGNALMKLLTKHGLNPVWLQGGMSPNEISDVKNKFNNDPKCRVIICQQTASARGHTLIGGEGNDRATNMVFCEMSFSYYERAQMEDRTHRGAQDQTCTYVDFVMSKVCKIVRRAVLRKEKLADTAAEMVKAARENMGYADAA